MEVLWLSACPNKHMVLTLPARGSFRILARHKRLAGYTGFVLPLMARVGRTCEALAGIRADQYLFNVQDVQMEFG